jgi:hypothetical protein
LTEKQRDRVKKDKADNTNPGKPNSYLRKLSIRVKTIKETFFSIPDGDDPVAQAEGNVLPVGGPGTGVDPCLDFVLLDRLLLGRPQPEVTVGARSQLKVKENKFESLIFPDIKPL